MKSAKMRANLIVARRAITPKYVYLVDNTELGGVIIWRAPKTNPEKMQCHLAYCSKDEFMEAMTYDFGNLRT